MKKQMVTAAATDTVNQHWGDLPPTVQMDNYIGEPDPENPKNLFSIRIPAKHQARHLSIVRMQDCDLTHILQDTKMSHRDMTKFTVPTTAGPCTVKLHFLIFPNKDDEIQVDYTYTPQTSAILQGHNFELGKHVDEEVRQHIHTNSVLKHEVSNFATIVHDQVVDFIDRTFYDSLAAGKEPDYLIMTPPPQHN